MTLNLVDVLHRPADFFDDDIIRFDPAWNAVLMLGTAQDGGFFTNLADGGSVWMTTDIASPNQALFVNTDVAGLVRFLGGFATLGKLDESEPRNARQLALAALRTRLEAIDPDALDASIESYWPLIFEHAETFG